MHQRAYLKRVGAAGQTFRRGHSTLRTRGELTDEWRQGLWESPRQKELQEKKTWGGVGWSSGIEVGGGM